MLEKSTVTIRWKCVCVFALLAASVSGQAPVARDVAANEAGIVQKLQKTISLDCTAMSIDHVIRSFAEQGQVNIVKGAQVEGMVTATLIDVPLGEALEHILAAHRYAYVVSDNMIRVVPKEEISEKKHEMISQVYRINNTDVKEVAAALEKFKSQEGSISYSVGSSNILVTDMPDKIEAIDTFLLEIDRITPLILVEVRIYDVTSAVSSDRVSCLS